MTSQTAMCTFLCDVVGISDFDGPEYAACRITIQGEGLETLQELLEFDFDGIKSFYAYVVRKLRGQIEDLLRNVGQCISNS